MCVGVSCGSVPLSQLYPMPCSNDVNMSTLTELEFFRMLNISTVAAMSVGS
jgi:hypothetical protein